MTKAFVEYALREVQGSHHTPPGKTLEQQSGEWLAASLSGKSPGKALYLGKFLYPSFISCIYANFIECGAWDEIDVVFWKEPGNQPRFAYPNLHFPDASTDHLVGLGDDQYDVICVADLHTYLRQEERIALAQRLLARLAPGGQIRIANRHIMSDGPNTVPANWLISGEYFRDSFYQVTPMEILSTFASGERLEIAGQAEFEALRDFTERLPNVDRFPHLRTLFSALYFITITPT
jgi:hypothetical protein